MPTAADDKLDSLVLDLLEWIAKKPRSYRETMEAWRTSCPRLAVWEEALDRGFVVRERVADGVRVTVTDKGLAFLRAARPRRCAHFGTRVSQISEAPVLSNRGLDGRDSAGFPPLPLARVGVPDLLRGPPRRAG